MTRQVFLTGIALFSMFFGGGNLIYPLAVGIQAGSSLIEAFAGFLTSGVLLPFLGVFTVVLHNGKSEDVFNVLGSRLKLIFPLLLLLFWIPLGSAPRCISLVESSFSLYGFSLHRYWFIIFYSLLTFLIALNKSKIIDILGFIMTPTIVISILAVVISSMTGDWTFGEAQLLGKDLFVEALVSGLKTQDFIAAFFFSSVICELVDKDFGKLEKNKFVLSSCSIGVTLLSLIYFAMIFCGSVNASKLASLSGDQLLFALLTHVGGSFVATSSLIVITFSCLSTSVALTAVFASYLEKITDYKMNFKFSAALTTLVTIVPAIMGFEVISSIISPSMELFYPLLLLISLFAVLNKILLSKNLIH